MKNVDEILRELIEIEPSFAAHKDEMRSLISEFLAKKPDTHLDAQFVASLRSRLLGAPTPSPFSSFFAMRYVALGLLVVILVPLGYYTATRGSNSPVFAMNQEIQNLGSNAYGDIQPQEGGKGGGAGLSNAAPVAQAEAPTHGETTAASSAGFAPAMAVAPTSGGASAADSVATPVATKMAMGMGGGASDARMMPPQGPVNVYSYVYKGGALDLAAAEGLVYRRVVGQNSSGQVASQLRKFNFGLINLGAYSDARVQNFSLIEDKPFGYSIQVSFDDGTVSINPNYNQWLSLNGKEPYTPLPLSALPKDEELISIAKQFLDAHDIDLTNYAEPQVQQYAEGIATDNSADSAPSAPDQVTVTYPLKIAGTPVYEDGAYPYGLQVTVSVRDKKVMSIYGLTSQTYTSSSYKLETDSDKVLSILKKGGPHTWVPQAGDGITIKNVEIEVGTPTKVLMHTYNYKDNDSQELFVPALMFPVTKAPAGEQYYPKEILVPLVPELLDQTSGGPVLYDDMRKSVVPQASAPPAGE